MRSLLNYLAIIILFLTINQYASFSLDLSISKKEPIELEDLCLKRPYHRTAQPWYWVPMFRAKLKTVGEKYSFPSRCFKKNVVSFKELAKDKITLTLENYNKTDTWCSELFIFHTSSHNFLQFVAFQGTHEIVLKRITQDDKDEIRVNGVKVYGFCMGFMNTVKSLLNTLQAFYGGLGSNTTAKNPKFRPNILKDQERANLRIMELFSHFTPERRINNLVNIDKSQVHSGDFLLIQRLDGIDQLIMLGSGGISGHSAVCAWKDGELYVVESQSGWYWPRDGIQRNKWDDWIKWAYAADFNVVLLPLREEYRNKFDVDKANAWFENEVEGLPYGYHNFVYTWIDTVTNNFPFFTTSEITEFTFSLISYFVPSLTDSFLTESLNKRVGKTGLSFQQAIAEAARQGKSMEEIIAEPEKEGIVYEDGLSYVCSCFVIAFWKQGGLFGDLEIESTEFGPKDIYYLDIFEKEDEYQRPQVCIDDNPELPYCQIMGKFVLKLDKSFNTIKPYSHMNERCSSQAPDFIREDGC